jgi:hypothetical protein
LAALFVTAWLRNSSTKLPRPENRVGGSSSFTVKKDSMIVNKAGTIASPTMNSATGATST